MMLLVQTEINDLKDIGKRSTQLLFSINMDNLADVEKAGVVNAYLRALRSGLAKNRSLMFITP
jgi:hypothetical protein